MKLNALAIFALLTVPFSAVIFSAGVLAENAEKAPDQKSVELGERRCIPINRIRSVKVLDKQNIRFEMAGNPDYVNHLPRKCPGLRKNDPIMYKLSINRLCDLDTISQLRNIGGGFMEGARCGLGKFVEEVPEAESGKEAS